MWIATSDRLPGLDDWDGNGKVLIWEENNGCMIGDVLRQKDLLRAPVTHWQRIPNVWNMASKMPCQADTDEWGCVLVLTLTEGPRIMGYNNPILRAGGVVGWQKLPAGPGKEKHGAKTMAD